MKTGDEKYLPARDRGPVKRFIRDMVDSRFSFVELMIPVLLVTTATAWSGNKSVASYGNAVLFGMLLLIVVDMLRLRFKLRRELTARFPGEPLKGTTYYAVMRSLQMKFMRLPKAQVRIGQRLPEHYRWVGASPGAWSPAWRRPRSSVSPPWRRPTPHDGSRAARTGWSTACGSPCATRGPSGWSSPTCSGSCCTWWRSGRSRCTSRRPRWRCPCQSPR